MSYAVAQDIIDLHGEQFLIDLADRDYSGAADPAAVTSALLLASSEIDSYLSERYAMPMPFTPIMVKTAAIEIAAYRLAKGTTLTEDIRKRYEDMVKWLRDIAAHKASLGAAIPELDPNAPVAGEWNAPVAFIGRLSRP